MDDDWWRSKWRLFDFYCILMRFFNVYLYLFKFSKIEDNTMKLNNEKSYLICHFLYKIFASLDRSMRKRDIFMEEIC